MLLTKTSGAKQGIRHEYAGGLIAPMPGQVRSVSVSVGDLVKKSQTLLMIEAMKMEIRIQALKDGRFWLFSFKWVKRWKEVRL